MGMEGLMVLPAIIAAIGTGAQMYMQKKAQKKAEARDDSSIQRRVADAKKAGIHPLYALGGSTGSGPSATAGVPDLGRMGQNIGSAIQKHMDPVTKTIQTLQLEKAGLENDMLRAQITRLTNETATQPPMPLGQRYMIEGQGQTAGVPGVLVQDEPLKRVNPAPEAPSQEAGAVTDVGFTRTSTGYFPVKSRDAQQRLD